MDLMFPHHECEIAQNVAASGAETVKYWIHNNMITINGQKMARSLGNFITLKDLFTGNNKLLLQAYSPMTIRFFILQAQYRSTIDFSNEALQAAEKGLQRLINAVSTLEKLKPSEKSSIDVAWLETQCFDALNDDLNTPITIANLFEGVRWINSIADGTESITSSDLDKIKALYKTMVFDILGLKIEAAGNESGAKLINDLISMVLTMRMDAKSNKDFATSDKIRDELIKLGVIVKDKKDGFDWELK
jgi:cysteinyl-tRNA synthetase